MKRNVSKVDKRATEIIANYSYGFVGWLVDHAGTGTPLPGSVYRDRQFTSVHQATKLPA